MGIFILLIVTFAGLIALLIWLRMRENRYLKKSTREAMGSSLREELEQEAQDAERRKKSFDEQLKKFGL